MAGGGFVSQGGAGNFEGKVTGFVIMTCLVAASGGLLFGYDIGISGRQGTIWIEGMEGKGKE